MVDAADRDFEAFFRREYASQVRVAYLILGDHGLALEVAQEAFARALARWPRIGGYDRPGAWVRLVCVRLALRVRDRRATELAERSDPAQAFVDHPRDLDLVDAVLSLPRAQRAVVTLHHLCDWPMAEVASAMRIRQSTARVHLARARAALAVRLTEEVSDG